MKKVILATALTVGVLATTAFAYNQNCPNAGQQGMMNSQQGMQRGMMGSGQGMQQQGMMNSQQGMQRGMMGRQQGMMNSNGMQSRGMMGRHGGIMRMFSQLNLSSDQTFELSVLRDEMHLSMKKLRGPNHQNKMMNFISNDGFDAKLFKETMNKEHQEMLDTRATYMEKTFKILTKEQIAELKTALGNR